MANSEQPNDDVQSNHVVAAQVVFANLEEPESPHNARGFQTAFFTQPDLDLESIRTEIEPSMFYYRRNGYDDPLTLPVESVFFKTKSGRVVLIRITPIFHEEDIFGRPKTLFAHCLVFDADTFRAAFDNNPFHVFDSFPFFSSYEDVLQKGGGTRKNSQLGRVNVPRTRSKVRESKYFQALKTKPDHLRLMLMLVSHASNPCKRRFTLQFDGPAGVMFDCLRDLMRLVPPGQRTACSFDTLFLGDDGSIKDSVSPHWANGVGRNQMLRQEGTLRFDVETGQFQCETNVYSPETPYESWLDQAFKASRTNPEALSVSGLRGASTLQDLCWGRSPDPADVQAVSENLFRDFVKINDGYIRRLLLKNLQKWPGPGVAEKMIKQAWDWIQESGAAGLALVTKRVPRERFVQWLLPEYLALPPNKTPTADELNAIEKCLDLEDTTTATSGDTQLLTALLWNWRREWKKFAIAAEALPADLFQECVSRVMGGLRYGKDFQAQIAPANGALGLYTFVSGESERLPHEPVAALLGCLFRSKVAPGVEIARVGQAERQRWSTVAAGVLDASIELEFNGPATTAETAPSDNEQAIPTPKRPHAVNVPQFMAHYRVTPRSWEALGTWSSLEENTDEIEELLRCIPDHATRQTHAFMKHNVGYSTRALVAQITRTSLGDNDPVIFLHVLLPDVETFEVHFDNDPFRLFASGAFRTSPPESESAFLADREPIPHARVSLKESPDQSATTAFNAETWKTLLLLAVMGSENHPSRRSVSLRLLSDTARSYEVLKSLFAVLPPGLRAACSFHTWYVNEAGGRIDPNAPYWAIGLPERARSGPATEVTLDLSSFQVSFRVNLPRPSTPFALWVHQTIDNELIRHPEFASYVNEAYIYDGFCCGEDAVLPEGAGKAYPSFVNAIRELIFKRVREAFEIDYASAFVPALIDWHLKQPPHVLKVIGPWLQQVSGPKATDSEWLSWLTEWTAKTLMSTASAPTHEVLKGIANLANAAPGNAGKSLLLLIYLRWVSRWHKLADAINKLDSPTFRKFTKWCLKTLVTSQGFPFQMNWIIKVDARNRLQFGPMLKPTVTDDDDFYKEARDLLAALVGFAAPETTYVEGKQSAPKLELVDISARRLVPDLFAILQSYSNASGGDQR